MAHPDTRSTSFIYPSLASMWVVTLHRLFLYSDPPLPRHPPFYWLRLFSSQTFSRINMPTFLKPSHSSYLPAYEEGTECSETSAYKIQTPGNCQKKEYNIYIVAYFCLHLRGLCSIFFVDGIYLEDLHPRKCR